MSAKPVFDKTLEIRVSAIKHLEVIAGIDRGCTLTKIAFLHKTASLDDVEFAPLRCLTFLNANFEDALLTMKSQARLPTSGKIHCSGVGCSTYKNTIKEVLGLDVFFVPEQLCMMRGAYLILQNMKEEDVLFPTPPFKAWTFASSFMDDAFGGSIKIQKQKGNFPAGVSYIGSGSAMGLVDASGKSKFVGLTPLAGKSFMGLARILLGTTDYDEIMALAAKGDRSKLDHQFRDILDSDETEYGQFPPSMPFFCFGKASDRCWTEESVTREDKAASLVGFFAGSILMDMSNASHMSGITRFYVSGNFAKAEIVRSLMLEIGTIRHVNLDIRFLSTGHTGVICAMLSSSEDTIERWRTDDIEV